MSETLGSLCDKLTVVILKFHHAPDGDMLWKLTVQKDQLVAEINRFVKDATDGKIPCEQLQFAANKIYKKEGNEMMPLPTNDIGWTVGELARINCHLWHDQEKVYNIQDIPPDKKDDLMKSLAHLNLRRNQCIDKINLLFAESLKW